VCFSVPFPTLTDAQCGLNPHVPPTDVLQKRPTTPTTKRYAISYMRDNTESFKYTRAVLKSLDKQVRAEVQRLGGNRKLEALLDQLKVPEEEDPRQ
jgi:negative regulator of sigma E activity